MSVSQTNPAIKEACDMVIRLSRDESERAIAEARDKYRMDFDAFLSNARYEEKLKITRNLLREKVPLETVSKATGLSLEEVNRLAADLHSL